MHAVEKPLIDDVRSDPPLSIGWQRIGIRPRVDHRRRGRGIRHGLTDSRHSDISQRPILHHYLESPDYRQVTAFGKTACGAAGPRSSWQWPTGQEARFFRKNRVSECDQDPTKNDSRNRKKRQRWPVVFRPCLHSGPVFQRPDRHQRTRLFQ